MEDESDEALLNLLKKDVPAWNEWRRENPRKRPKFDKVDINFWQGKLQHANLSYLNLRGGYFREANLLSAVLGHADCSNTECFEANFNRAFLDGATFRRARLGSAVFAGCSLVGTDFTDALMGGTVFTEVDLSRAKGLETVRFAGPISIGIDTMYLSHPNIPRTFLEGAGIPDTILTYLDSLITTPIDYNSCFISYSSEDKDFAERLYADLRAKKVRCWFAPHDLKTGDPIRSAIDRAIHVHDKLLVILSVASIRSQWVEQEVETAFERERDEEGRKILFPIRIDDAVEHTETAWARAIKRGRQITDFTCWKQHDEYQKQLDELLHHLEVTP